MENYNDFATVADEKISEFKKAYQNAMSSDRVEILKGDSNQKENDDTARFIGDSPVSNPINNQPSNSPVNSPSSPNQSNNNSPSSTPARKAKNNSLNQLNLLLFALMLELIYGNGGNSNCSNNR